MKHYNNMARQAGMTLIELTVVLLILIGLAGLLIPYVGSFMQTTHDSTNSNNITQLNNALGRYVSDHNKLPPHVDTLTNDIAAATGTGSCAAGEPSIGAQEIYCGLANTAMFNAVTFATDSVMAQSLAKSGIHMAVGNDPNIANKTFGTSTNMYMLNDPSTGDWDTITFAEVADGGFTTDMMSTAQEKHLAKALGRDPMVYKSECYDYIGVGLGDNNELIQNTMAAAPVYFPQDAQYGPAERYAHFIAILEVQNSTAAGCPGTVQPAKFLGVVANVPASESADSLVGINTLLSQGWENRSGS